MTLSIFKEKRTMSTENVLGLDIAQRGTLSVSLSECLQETFKEEILTREEALYADTNGFSESSCTLVYKLPLCFFFKHMEHL